MASNKRDQLLSTAEDLFYRDGYHATGIDRILAESGVAKMTLYKHFKSNDELIVAVLDARHEAMLRDAPGVLARAIESASREERTDPGLLKERIRLEMQRLFRKRAGRRPLVLPVVMEV